MSRSTQIRWSGVITALGGAVFLVGSLTPLRGPLRAGVPLSIGCMAVGAVGLFAVLHRRHPRLERWGLLLGVAGLTLGIIGMAGSALGVLSPNPWAAVINTGEHLGLPLIGAGMIIWGILTVRTRALGWWSFTPIPIGALGLVGAITLLPPALRIPDAILAATFAATWILLGLGLANYTAPAPHTTPP